MAVTTETNRIDFSERKRIIYGQGSKDSKVMIIGEAPGADEERLGRPFVGRSGELLERLLNQVGLLRSDCYITNVIKEKPNNNNIKPYLNLSKKIVESDLYIKYKQYLIDEIMDVNPNVIVVTGAVPLYALTGNLGITKWRGSIIEGVTGHKIIPIIHPAAALRQYLYRHFITYDLKRVKSEMEYPEIKYKDRHYIIEPSYLQVMDFLAECMRHEWVGFDIEVSYKQVSCISFAYDEHKAMSIPFTKGGQEYWSVDQERDIWIAIAKILESEEIKSIGQNVTFDSTFLFKRYGIKSKNLHDTMIQMALLFPDFPKGLDFITSIYTDIPYYKDDRKAGDSIVPDDSAFWIYNAKDSIVLMEAFPKMMKELERMKMVDTYENQRKLIQPLLYMTEHGMRMDIEKMRIRGQGVGEDIDRLEKELEEIVGREINPRSPKQLMEYFYGSKKEGGLGITPYKDKGKPTTNEGALIRLARGTANREPLEEARILLEHRGLEKLRGTYLNMTLDEDGRLRSSMNPVGARTGRLSSSKTIFGTGMNVQNQPPEMREYMLADDQCVAYEIDLAQAENRVVAYIAPEIKMIDAFETDADVHSRTASYIFGMPEDEIKEMDEEGVMCETIGTGSYTHRFWGKKANHAFNYGQGSNAFAYQVEIPNSEGKMIHSKYHAAYPGVRKYHNWVRDKLERGRMITNLMGRTYWFLDRWSHQMFEAAFAFIPQSTIGDIINKWGLNAIYYDQEKFAPVRLLNQIHDSIVFQISKEYTMRQHAETILEIVKSLEQPLEFRGRTFNIPCELKIFKHNLKIGSEVDNVGKLSVDELTQKIKGEIYGANLSR